MNWLYRKSTTLILLLIGVIGILLVSYPTFADWWNSFHQSRAVANYAQSVSELDTSEYDEMIAEAAAYNEDLAALERRWVQDEEQTARYNATLDVSGTGIMGYLDIPLIGVTLPLYHGTDESVLQVAIGHIQGTSLPVGGETTHCAVSSHRGLPSARLFTDLDKLREGDTWTVSILNTMLTYEADQIRIVEPNDLSNLEIEPGRDYFTLVTCTPYGINSHRLLIRGHRIENAEKRLIVLPEAVMVDPMLFAAILGIPTVLLLFVWIMVGTDIGNSRRRARKRTLAKIRRGDLR